jgi:repressor LexA
MYLWLRKSEKEQILPNSFLFNIFVVIDIIKDFLNKCNMYNKDFRKILIALKGGFTLYEKFEQLINERELTAYRVAKDTNLAPTVFSDWKTGKSKPKVDKLMILAKYFNVPIEYFLEE